MIRFAVTERKAALSRADADAARQSSCDRWFTPLICQTER